MSEEAVQEKPGNGAGSEAKAAATQREAGPTLIQLRGIGKSYERGGERLKILSELDLDVPKASFEALMGPSGSGKSTLLNLIAGLDRPTSGTITIDGKRIDSMSDGELARWRSNTIGFVFQSYNLMPVLTAVENVELPLLLTKVASSERRKRAETALRIVGLDDRKSHYPRQLSGGQEQRVAIARAIVNDPTIIVADEPTGDLDRQSADEILTLLTKLNKDLGKTIVMVTHDPSAAERASIIRRLDKGALQMTLTGLAVKNVLRNKFRAVLTVVGVAVATLTFVLLRTLVTSWTEASDYAVKDRLVTRHKITFVMTLPLKYIDVVRNAPHIRVSTFANWFGAKDPKHDKEFFANLAVDSDTYFKVYDDMAVPPDQMAAWQSDPQGAIVGDVLAKKMGWKVGDKVSLESGIYPTRPEWDFKIDGIYEAKTRAVDRSTFHFHWKYMNESLPPERKDQIGSIISRTDDPNQTATIATQVDKLFEDRDIQTLSQDEHAFTSSFLAGVSAVLTVVNVISVVILVIMLLILGNTIAMGVRERTNEYGVLKALGFSSRQIAGFIYSESVVIAAAGGVLGVALAYPFVEQGMGRWLEENMGSWFPYFRVPIGVTAWALGFALGLGLLAAAIPAARAGRLRVVDALRRVA